VGKQIAYLCDVAHEAASLSGMTSGQSESLVDRSNGPDAAAIFRYPVVMMGLLTGMAGALDVVEYRDFGLFTANQGGNLVLFWVRLQEGSSLTWVIGASILAAIVGIVLVVALRMRVRWFTGALGTRLTLILSAVLLLSTFAVTAVAPTAVGSQALSSANAGSSEWWLMVRLVAISAMAMGMLGATIVSIRGINISAIAPTGTFVTSTRMATARLLGEHNSQSTFRSIVTIPVSWTLGAAIAALVPIPRDALVLCAVGLILLVVLNVRTQTEVTPSG
jgi:uncharacterized membrane protein YoaK (UPF0700 family)